MWWLLYFISRVLGEDGSLWFLSFPLTIMESLSHEQAGERTTFINTWGPIILSLPSLVEPQCWEWGLNEGREPCFLVAFVRNSASARCKTELGRMRNACSLLFLRRHHSFSWRSGASLAASSWLHLMEWIFYYAELGVEKEETGHNSSVTNAHCINNYIFAVYP